jgi:hypothetical protein
MTTRIYGYRNVAYFSGPSPDGYARWYESREQRDRALRALRAEAVDHGLSSSAATAGIYPVAKSVHPSEAELLDEIKAEGSVRTA